MDYKKYTEGIIFIDDNFEEIKEAIKYFNENKINTLFFTPLDVAANSSCIGYNFVFLDLSYDGVVDIKSAVVALRKIAEVGEKHFVIVAWTQHRDELEKLQEEINEKMSDCYPLKLLDGEKFEILNKDEHENFDIAFLCMLKRLESENPLLFKLLEWKQNMSISVKETFNQLIETSYKNGEIDLNKSMGILANKTLDKKNVISALNTLNQRVNDVAMLKLTTMEDLELEYDESNITENEKLKYNCDYMFSNCNRESNIPGSIYIINESVSNETLKKSIEEKERLQKDLDFNETIYKSFSGKSYSFDNIVPIAIDITPNCAYANKNINTTFLEGIIIKKIISTSDREVKIKKIKEMDVIKRDNILSYGYMDVNDEICFLIIFLNKSFYKLEEIKKIAQLNNNVKVDIQHFYGSWVSKVGTSLYDK